MLLCAIGTLDKGESKPIRKRQTILSSKRTLHTDYDSKGSTEKKSLVVILKGPDAKTNWLAVNRQS
jgi:hypothetical protein